MGKAKSLLPSIAQTLQSVIKPTCASDPATWSDAALQGYVRSRGILLPPANADRARLVAMVRDHQSQRVESQAVAAVWKQQPIAGILLILCSCVYMKDGIVFASIFML